MKKLLLSALAAFTLSGAIYAQDEVVEETAEETSPLSFYGSVDAYFKATTQSQSPGSSFADAPQNGFALGMINLGLEKSGEQAGFVADLVFGPRGAAAIFNSPQFNAGNEYSGAEVNQLYAYWNATDGLTFTLGNFNTFLGYEVISPAGNFNYTTSFMFSNGPFSHTGLKADIALSDNLSGMVAIMNATDFTEFNPVNTFTYGAQLGYENDMGGAWLNFLVGDQDGSIDEDDAVGTASGGTYFQVDLTTGWDVSDEFYLGFNGTYTTIGAGEEVTIDGTDTLVTDIDGDNSGFLGAAVYAQYSLSESFALGFRGEYFQSYVGDMTTDVIDLTLSANYTVGALTFIPEVRVDLSEDAYMDADGTPNASSSLPQFYLAAVYAF